MASDALVVGLSGRVIAEALADLGFHVDVFDCFGDQETRAVADRWFAFPEPLLPRDYAATERVIRDWKAQYADGLIVVTSGLEGHSALLQSLEDLPGWCGVQAQTLKLLKDPRAFQKLIGDLSCRVPETSFEPRPEPAWIKKTLGQSGGIHNHGTPYWQRVIPGQTYSLLFCATADAAVPVSFQSVLSAPSATAPYRFGGCVMNPPLEEPLRQSLLWLADRLCQTTGVRGLMGIDVQWDGTDCWLLDINPRPTAPLLLFPRHLRQILVRQHLHSFLSQNKKEFPALERFPGDLNPAFAFVYAGAPLSIPADFQFPADCTDLPCLPSMISSGMPICTVQVPDGGLGELRRRIGALRECLQPVAGQVLIESL